MDSTRPLLSTAALFYSSFDDSDSDRIVTMGTPTESIESGSETPTVEPEKGAIGTAVVTETKLFKRSGRDGTFDNDSLESFYKPIDEYEGRHRYDPQFEWTAEEEKRIVRIVRFSRIPHWEVY